MTTNRDDENTQENKESFIRQCFAFYLHSTLCFLEKCYSVRLKRKTLLDKEFFTQKESKREPSL